MKRRTILILAFLLTGFLLSGCVGNTARLSALPVIAEEKATPAVKDASLQELIDKAEDGSEIVIKSGTYSIPEPLRIEGKKQLSIKGEGNVIILGENIDQQIFIINECGSITIEDIRARHKSSRDSDETKVFEKRSGSVVDIENTDKAVFVNCEFEGCGVYGIYTEDVAEVEITGCYIHHNSWRALGFHAKVCVTNVNIKDCTITNNTDFIEKSGSVNVNMEGQNVIKFNSSEGYKSR